MKAVLVFCEGTHDVAFVHRSLRALGGYDDVKEPIGKLPSPFGADKTTPRGLVATRFDQQDIEEFRLDNEYPPTPKYDSFVEKDSSDTMFVLLRAGGKDPAKQVIDLAPMVESWTPDKYAGAKAFIEDNTRQGDAASHDQARRLKAIFTVTGQFGHPGSSLSVILRKGLPDDKFSTSRASQALVEFLEGVPWKSDVFSSASKV